MSTENPLDEFRELWSRSETDSLSAEDRRRLSELIAGDDGVRSAMLDQLEVEALLRWHHGGVRSTTHPAPLESAPEVPQSGWRPSRAVVAATCTVAGLLVCVGLLRYSESLPRAVHSRSTDSAAPSPPDESVAESAKPIGSRHQTLDPPESIDRQALESWSEIPAAGTVYRIVASDRIQLETGWLRLESHKPSQLVVDVVNGSAASKSGKFQIRSSRVDDNGTFQIMTRIEVLEGAVRFANDSGTVTAKANQGITCKAQDRPRIERPRDERPRDERPR